MPMNFDKEEEKWLNEVFPTRTNRSMDMGGDNVFTDIEGLEDYCQSLVEDEYGNPIDPDSVEEVAQVKNTISDLYLDGTLSQEEYDDLMSILS